MENGCSAMTAEKKTIKFQMMMSPREAEILDDWAFANRIKSRAEAIRRLTRAALEVDSLADNIYALYEELQRREAYIKHSASLPEDKATAMRSGVTAVYADLVLRLDHIANVFKAARTERAGEALEGVIAESRDSGAKLRKSINLDEKLAQRPRERRKIRDSLEQEMVAVWLAEHPDSGCDAEEALAAAFIDRKWYKSYIERPDVAKKRSAFYEEWKRKRAAMPPDEQPD